MAECAFCRIVDGEETAHLLYEDERTVAFLDDDPAIAGHTLVTTKSHREFLFTVEESLSTAVFRTVRTLAMAMDRALEPDGVSVFYTSAVLVGSISHAHVHLIPRYADDDIQLALARESVDDDEAARIAARLREEL